MMDSTTISCPYCGKEMEAGEFYYFRPGLYWCPSALADPSYYSERELTEAGGIVLSSRSLRTLLRPSAPVTAYVCKACGKGIFSFEPEK